MSRGNPATRRHARHLRAERKAARERAIDYRDVLFRVLRAVGNAEGTWFQGDWGISEAEIARVQAEYDRWETFTAEKGGSTHNPAPMRHHG